MSTPFDTFRKLTKEVTSVKYTRSILRDIIRNSREDNVEPEGLGGTSLDSSNFVVYLGQSQNPSDFFMLDSSSNTGKLVIPKSEREDDIMKIRLVGMSTTVPELYLLVNPASLTINQDKSYTTYYTRSGPKTEWNGNKPLEISVNGKSGGFYMFDEDVDESGYGVRNYFKTLAFKNIMSLVSLYKNNGTVYGSKTVDKMGGVEIIYKHKIYHGSFTSMSLSFKDSNPSTLDYNFSFRSFIQVNGRPAL